MTMDPLADVIHKSADEWFDTSDGQTIWEYEAAAVRTHIATVLDAEDFDKAIRCLAYELPGPVWDDVNRRWWHLRTTLLGTSE